MRAFERAVAAELAPAAAGIGKESGVAGKSQREIEYGKSAIFQIGINADAAFPTHPCDNRRAANAAKLNGADLERTN
ncbi:hypothetical protein [Trinickia mobilis]|uniref:hypothetical protein n=1 Tax=Trinickia mobilis TaxID=2816356 RepID=UPI001A8FD90E|nr:hypothetical protein [Trinickia mobilis]